MLLNIIKTLFLNVNLEKQLVYGNNLGLYIGTLGLKIRAVSVTQQNRRSKISIRL